MEHIIRILIGLSALGFALAVICSLADYFVMGVTPEAYSRASGNLALIAIALSVIGKK